MCEDVERIEKELGISGPKSNSGDCPRICLITAFILRLIFESLRSSMNPAQPQQSIQIFIEHFSVLSIVPYAAGGAKATSVHF